MDERIEGKALFFLSFSERRKILGILGQGGLYRIVDHIGDGTIRCRSLQAQGAVYVGLEIDGGAFLGIHAWHYDVLPSKRQDA
ncbi:MAG: hypothetical protein AABZ67_11280 [Pseudomonadota bacterium]